MLSNYLTQCARYCYLCLRSLEIVMRNERGCILWEVKEPAPFITGEEKNTLSFGKPWS